MDFSPKVRLGNLYNAIKANPIRFEGNKAMDASGILSQDSVSFGKQDTAWKKVDIDWSKRA